ncbi:PEP-CTERM sorting domain-containing protein [Rheinheimera sp.]|uniref:PEP-CTERM sorting domain-containing protein n=1 Tax=Rheinheimera sp. TaxID=1869214 RepID=UPI0027367F0E|nr:PEP-CTERM sorting domain-containing protein [Rheinheimera sp.]MDP2715843.1 PEP-CTERM sorting domain-containing protein [Rheinheimera sp.]
MKYLKTLVSASTLALSSFAIQASEINVGGVVWDPNWTDGGMPASEMDFIGRHSFTQWYSTTSDAVGSLGSATTAATLGEVLAAGGGGGGGGASTGYYLSGAGEFYQLNNPSNDVVVDSVTGGNAGSFCPGCELTYAFGGIELFDDLTFDVSNAWARIYVDFNNDFSVPVTTGNAATMTAASLNGNIWLDLAFTSFEFLSLAPGGGIGSGFVAATFDIIGGLAAANFDPQQMSYNGSAFFGTDFQNINLNSRFSGGGNGSVLANTIPEPGILFLFGAGLVGLGVMRKKAA